MSSLRTTVVAPARPPIARMVIGLLSKVIEWDQRYRTAHRLKQLDDRILHDVGLHRADFRSSTRNSARRG